ncbi:toxin regulator [Clostridium butyricum]|nr:toxin regulator [Clostridium butyricum]
MTNDEGKIAEDIISNWNSLSDDFKEKYNDSKNKLNNSIKEYKKQKEDEEKARKQAEEAQEKARKEAEEAVAYDTGITYNQLARTPDDYKNSKVKFSGKVLQVMEGDKETDLRIAVDGNYDTVIFVGYDPKITSVRILEDDYVTIKGKSIGIYTYQSTMGGNISIPGIWVDKIEIN